MKKRFDLYNKNAYSKVNEDNKILLEDYEAELELRGRSKGTIYQYKADIKAFYCWLVNHYHNANILKVKKRVYKMFFLSLIKNKTSHNRINRLESSLRNLLNFAVESEDYEIEGNPMAHIKGMQKKLVRKIIFLSDDDITLMINWCLKHHKYQQALYVSLSYDSAARRNEIAQVKREDLRHGHMTSNVIGKENKKFPLIFFDRTKRIFDLWDKQRGDDDVKSLWRTRENGHYKAASYQTLYYWCLYLRKVLKKCRPDHKYLKFNCHSFRHSALQELSTGHHYILKHLDKDKMDLDTLRVYAHHSSTDMTRSYLKNDDDKKLENAFNL